MRMWEAMIRAKAAAAPITALGAATPGPPTPLVVTDEPHGGPKERARRVAQRAADALVAACLGSIRMSGLTSG